MEVRNAFFREAVTIDFTPDENNPDTWDRTSQDFKDDCDINQIMARYQRTGAIDHVRTYGGSYSDIAPGDLQTALNQVALAQQMFNDLPSKVRDFCRNDPGTFLEFVQDPRNQEQMVEFGLATVNPDLIPPPAQPKEAPSVAPGQPVTPPPVTGEPSGEKPRAEPPTSTLT